MSAISYADILAQLVTIFDAEPETSGVRVYIERDPEFGVMDIGTGLSVYLLSRSAHTQQVLAAAKRTRYLVRFAVTAFAFDLESYESAARKRDDLLAGVELALMRNTSLGGLVTSSWLEGGDFVSARGSAGSPFIAAADTILVADVSAINT